MIPSEYIPKEVNVCRFHSPEPQREASPDASFRPKQERNRTRTWNLNRQQPDCPASQQRRILHRHASNHVLVLSQGLVNDDAAVASNGRSSC